MALTTVTNGDVDTAASAVAAPYGPLVRVSDAEALGTFNSGATLEFTSDLDVTVYASYDQITDDAYRVTNLLERQHSVSGVNAQAHQIFLVIQALAANMAAMAGPPYSNDEYQLAIDTLRTIRQMVGAQWNHGSSIPVDGELEAEFTLTDVSDPEVHVANTSTGGILYLWDWGDGTTSVGQSPADHEYEADDTYTVTLTVIGRGEVATVSHDVVITGVP